MKTKYLLQCPRTNRFYFRIIVPKSLRSKYGKREIRRSLHTTDLTTAQHQAINWGHKFKTLFIEEKISTEFQIFYKSNIQTNIQATSNDEPIYPLLSEAIESYCKEKIAKNAWTANSQKEFESIFIKSLKFLKDKKIDQYNRDHAIDFLNSLKRRNLKQQTIAKNLNTISSLFNWLQLSYDIKNPFTGLTPKQKINVSKEREPYTNDELKSLFENYPIDHKRPSRYWIPHIMLFSGMRPSEIAQLTKNNIIAIDNIFCFQLTSEMNLKTVNAQRIIPIHAKLIKLGLLEFINSQKENRIFNELNPERAKPAGAVSSYWNTTHTKNIKKNKEYKKSLYSLRHNVVTALRNTGIKETFASELVGHQKGTNITFQRYASSNQIKPLKEAIESISWPFIEFSLYFRDK
ncbi:MAG: hypothetical protein CSB24_00095 [Deltaproteobacteria bacterium]|nr:MAG: hypothetical protein CSB24_00095 [Deltaproteobacteria bacterium]